MALSKHILVVRIQTENQEDLPKLLVATYHFFCARSQFPALLTNQFSRCESKNVIGCDLSESVLAIDEKPWNRKVSPSLLGINILGKPVQGPHSLWEMLFQCEKTDVSVPSLVMISSQLKDLLQQLTSSTCCLEISNILGQSSSLDSSRSLSQCCMVNVGLPLTIQNQKKYLLIALMNVLWDEADSSGNISAVKR